MDLDRDPTATAPRSTAAGQEDLVPGLPFFAGVCRAGASLLRFAVAVVRETRGGIDPIHLEPGILRAA